jgi:hypothetical protein
MALGDDIFGTTALGELIMSTIRINVTNVCSGGGHLTISATENLGTPIEFVVDMDEIMQPLSADELRGIVKYLVRSHAQGKTSGQETTLLQTGITVVI